MEKYTKMVLLERYITAYKRQLMKNTISENERNIFTEKFVELKKIRAKILSGELPQK